MDMRTRRLVLDTTLRMLGYDSGASNDDHVEVALRVLDGQNALDVMAEMIHSAWMGQPDSPSKATVREALFQIWQNVDRANAMLGW